MGGRPSAAGWAEDVAGAGGEGDRGGRRHDGAAQEHAPFGPRQQLLTVSMAGQPAACPTVVFLKTGPDSYLPYDLLGGP